MCGIGTLKALPCLFPCETLARSDVICCICLAQYRLFVLSATTSSLGITLFSFDLVDDLLMVAETKSKSKREES